MVSMIQHFVMQARHALTVLCIVALFFAGLSIIQAQSVITVWVSPSGGAGSCGAITGTNDPGAYMTPAALVSNACASAGDTVMWKAGTYTGSRVLLTDMLPPGTSASVVSTHLCATDRGCIVAFSSVPAGEGVMQTTNAQYYQIGRRGNGFIADCVNGGDGCGGVRLQLSGAIIATGVTVENVLVRNQHATAFNMSESQPTNYYDGATFRYIESEDPATPIYEGDGSPHPMYIKGWNVVVEYCTLKGYNVTQSRTIHGWHNTRHSRVRYCDLEVKPLGRGYIAGDDETRPADADNELHHNVFRCPTLDCGIAIQFSGSNRANNSRAYNNVAYGFSTFLSNGAGNLDSHFINNVCTAGSCAISNSGTNLNCGGTCTTTNPTVTAASHFVDAANGDFSLISGSSLINAGIDVGLPYNGSAPDRGASESIPAPTASITTNVLTLTFTLANVPIQNLTTTGVTVACTPNGDSCPSTPVVASVQRRAGTDTIVDITISGITSDACLSGQNWTISYSPGSWSNSLDIGGTGTRNQKVFTISNLAASNACTGSGPGGGVGTPYIEYLFTDGTGTTITNTGSFGASGNGTLTGGSWASGGGVTLSQQSTDNVAIPYGSGVNPTTQSLTIAFTVDVLPGNESATRSYFGSQIGTNQRFHVLTGGGTFGLGVGATSGSAASQFSVFARPTQVCITANASTDVVTLHIDGEAATTSGGVVTGVASYVLASNFELGRIASLTTGGGGTYTYFVLYQSVEDCAAIYTATLGSGGGAPTGTFIQTAVRAQEVFTTVDGTPINQRAINTATKAAINGAVAFVFQVDCDDCGATAFRLTYRKNGTGSWLQVPATETSDGISMWGDSTPTYFNTGNPGAEISGTCTEQTGATITTSVQTPTVPFPASGCVVLRYVIRVGANAVAGEYFELRLETQAGGALDTYSNLARVDVMGQQLVQ